MLPGGDRDVALPPAMATGRSIQNRCIAGSAGGARCRAAARAELSRRVADLPVDRAGGCCLRWLVRLPDGRADAARLRVSDGRGRSLAPVSDAWRRLGGHDGGMVAETGQPASAIADDRRLRRVL